LLSATDYLYIRPVLRYNPYILIIIFMQEITFDKLIVSKANFHLSYTGLKACL
jgi:hypothetical protein